MKVYELSRTSWHYKLAMFYEQSGVSDNFCSYFWEVVLGFGKVLLIAVGLAFLLMPWLICPTAFVLYGISPWDVPGPSGRGANLFSALFFIESILVVLGVLIYVGVKLDQWQKDRQAKRWEAMRELPENKKFWEEHLYWPWQEYHYKEPGFIKLAYRRLRDKTCVKLVFK